MSCIFISFFLHAPTALSLSLSLLFCTDTHAFTISSLFTEKTGGEIVPLSTYVAKFGGTVAPAPVAPALVDE